MAADAQPDPAPSTAVDVAEGAAAPSAPAAVVEADRETSRATAATVEAIGRIAPVRDASLVGANVDPHGSMLGRGMLSATLGHVAMALLVVLYPVDIATWSGGGAGDGIDVELISSRDLTVAEPTQASAASAASTPTPTATPVEPIPAAEKTALLKPTLAPESDPSPLDTAAVIDSPREAVEAPPTPVEKPPERLPPKVEQTTVPTDASDASRTAEDRDRSTAGSARRAGADSAATVNATAGEIEGYKRQMVEAIDRCKPKDTRGNRGIVWISYVVDPDGGVGLAYVDQTSGVKLLDTLALDALRGCRFGPPLAGLSRDMRFYRIPFIFK